MDQAPVLAPEVADLQTTRPSAAVALSRVGVTGVERMVRVGGGTLDRLFVVDMECFVDLGHDQRGAHMSRFEETVNEALDEVVRRGAFSADRLAADVAERVRERQGSLRAEVSVRARSPQEKAAPVSAARSEDIYTLLGSAVASPLGTRRLTGVQAQGMTACPCAQAMVEARSRDRLSSEGFGEEEIERILRCVPVATHNQRGLGTLFVGCPEDCDEPIDDTVLLGIVESSMSSEIFELMKRSDEVEVVERAHAKPRFVEDCVREMIRQSLERFRALGAGAFVLARQENLETIHRHNVVAERYGLLGDLETGLLDGEGGVRHVDMRAWLEGAGA
jgi:GTP cyclohydrolase I/GTP cyclohydrolase-4